MRKYEIWKLSFLRLLGCVELLALKSSVSVVVMLTWVKFSDCALPSTPPTLAKSPNQNDQEAFRVDERVDRSRS